MRNKITIIILLISSIILLLVALFVGIEIGSFKVLSISEIKEKNISLDEKIDRVSTITSVNYPAEISKLDKNFEEYIIKKEKYEELAGFSIGNKEYIYETKKYDISYLWKVLGKYARNRELTIGIDVKLADSQGSGYNLNFVVSGQYVNIIQFISDLENDSDLYFRIYDFAMSGSDVVTAKFLVKNVNIDPNSLKNTNSATLSSITNK